MKANFALTLSFTGIRLLHRAAGGWRFVGEVALDDPDLDGALAALRKTALELEPAGLRTKLVLPGTQIRYLTIDTSKTPSEELRAAAARALDGATPYAVGDLVFDLSPDGDQTHVAAVARETLAEAEAFAVQHRFAPISLVAIPEEEAFLGEPFFGATRHAAELLGPEDEVEPDGIAVVELGPREWPEGPVVEVAEDAPVADEDAGAAEAPTAADPAPVAPEPAGTVPDEAGADAPGAAPAEGPPEAAPAPAAGETDDTAAPAESPPDDTPVLADSAPDDMPAPAGVAREDAAQPSVGFASRRSAGAGGAPKLGGVTRRFDPAAGKAPEPEDSPEKSPPDPEPEPEPGPAAAIESLTRPAPAPDPETDPEPTSRPSATVDDDDVPNPPPAALAAFLSRRQAGAGRQEPPAPQKRPARDKAPEPSVAPPAAPPTAPSTAREASPELAPAPAEPAMAYAVEPARPEIRPLRVPRPQSERQRMTVFGARQPEADGVAAVGGKPRFLGLILTVMLLIFLVGVAAWAAIFVDDGLARFFGRTPEAPAIAEELAPEPEPQARATEEPQTAALEEALPPEPAPPEPEALAEPAPPPVFDPIEAAAQYAVTGIWTIPPEVPSAPGQVDLDDLYVTSIDPANLSFDAVALQPEPETRTDRAPLAPASPAPPGTEFELDDRGLVIPTPEGAMSPDGIIIRSGPPPVVPPDTPERAEEVPEDIDAAARRELFGFRPRARPEDLVENTERQRLGGLSRSELAEYRPRLRPDAVKQAEEEKDETPTAQAAASSLRPANRPSGFERIVARAQQRNLRPETESEATVETASVAPRTVAPSIPSRSSVAREATVRNAINLRRINLMGVYGSPSNRRALVRLSNGRYKKVKVGDRIDGGRVSAIGDSELSYTKGNRNIVLKMPRT